MTKLYHMLEDIRESVLDKLLVGIAAVALIPVTASLYRMFYMGWQKVMAVHLAGYILIGLTAFFRRKIPYPFKAFLLSMLAFSIGAAATVNVGMVGSGGIFMLFSVLFAVMFLNAGTGMLFMGASIIILAMMAAGTGSGMISFNFNIEETALSPSSWISKIGAFILFSTFIIISLGSLIRHLAQSSEKLMASRRELVKTNKTLSINERKYREIYNVISDGLVIRDAENGKLMEVNAAMLDMYGYSRDEMIEADAVDLSSGVYPYDESGIMEKVQKAREEGSQIFEWHARKKSGELFWVEVNLQFSEIRDEERYISTVRDITDRKRINEILIQNEKMLSVGGLAAGMAHEINNPLASVIQNTQVLTRRLTDVHLETNVKAANEAGTSVEAVNEYIRNRGCNSMLKAIRDSGLRMASIVKNMLSFVRESDFSFSSHDPVVLMDKSLELASSDFDLKKHYDFKSIEMRKEYDDNLPMLVCEAGKIQQVILNILSNGAYSMFRRKTVEGDFLPKFILRIKWEKASQMVRMEIEDNGCGIEKMDQKRVFEPFFTTKPPGEGTGLGLSVSYFIITENHNGTMEVKSMSGRGARFIIRLPIDQEKRNHA